MIERVFVVIPAYNAAATIAAVFDRIPPAAAERISRYVVVDDGSSDGTAAVVEKIADGPLNINLLRHESNRGYGAAEKTLLRHALEEGAEAVLLLHADGQYSPEKIPAMLAPFDRGEADLVQGSRMLGGGALKGGMPFYKYVANKCLTAIENAAFGLKMAEYHSGYMAYSRPFLETVPFTRLSDSFDFDLEMIVMAKVAAFAIAEVAIPTIYADEVSHLNPVRYGLDVLTVVRRYRGGHYQRLLGEKRYPVDSPPER
jgi:glycosyltransferase involved in cell wall biosynthesis